VSPSPAIIRHFADVPDPRIDRTKKHALADILLITLCAVVGGAESWDSVATFGKAKRGWLERFVPLANGIPSSDTFERVFARLDPKAFQKCVVEWLAAVCEATGLKHLAIDGKAIRGAGRSTFSGCLHLVNAWSVENRMILGQEAVADKSNEIAAIPRLLEVLDLKGALVTIDASVFIPDRDPGRRLVATDQYTSENCAIGSELSVRLGRGTEPVAIRLDKSEKGCGNRPIYNLAIGYSPPERVCISKRRTVYLDGMKPEDFRLETVLANRATDHSAEAVPLCAPSRLSANSNARRQERDRSAAIWKKGLVLVRHIRTPPTESAGGGRLGRR
jgi:predicted transposase YbfD/YdcC